MQLFREWLGNKGWESKTIEEQEKLLDMYEVYQTAWLKDIRQIMDNAGKQIKAMLER